MNGEGEVKLADFGFAVLLKSKVGSDWRIEGRTKCGNR